jgi:LysR family transcriptional regulator, carnitine catabolism transcriptional activator
MIDSSSRQLRAFLLVAQYRSFSRAAGLMLVTPPALSVLIRELETQVGARLFDRTTRHVALTSAGTELLTVAERSVRELEGAMSRIGQSSTGNTPALKLGAVPLFAATVVPEAIRSFRRRRPAFRYQLFDGDAAAIIQRIGAGTIDVGLGVFFAHLPGIRRTPLFRFSLLAVWPKNQTSSSRAMTWSALKREALISLDASLPLQRLIDKHLVRAGVAQPPRLIVNSLNTVIAMVEAGEGVGIIPSYWLPACRGRAVVTSGLSQPVVRLEFHQIRHAGRKLPAAAEEFVAFLEDYISRWAERSGFF